MKKTAYSKLQKKYGGQFVARRGSRVLASAPSLGSLKKTLKTKGIPYTSKITIGYIDPQGVVCVYRVSVPL